MRLRIRVGDVALSTAERQEVERSVRLEFGRHASSVEVTRIAFKPAEVDAATDETWCGLRVTLSQGASLSAADRAADARSAAVAATRRIVRRLQCRDSSDPPRRPIEPAPRRRPTEAEAEVAADEGPRAGKETRPSIRSAS